MRMNTQRHRSALLSPALLMLAHVTTVAALLAFGLRAGASPFHPQALWVYWAAVPLALLATGWLIMAGSATRSRHARPAGDWDLLLAFAPALASLALLSALWLSYGLGGARFIPFGMQSGSAVAFFSQVPALVIVAVAVAYGAPGFLLAAGGAQLLVYFSARAWFWPDTGSLLGANPQAIVPVFFLYGVGMTVVLSRRWLLPRARPGLWLAGAAGALLGGWLVTSILSAMPGNGDYMAYQASTRAVTMGLDERYLAHLYTVPANAWSWPRPAALGLAKFSMFSALVTPLVWLAAAPKRRDKTVPAR